MFRKNRSKTYFWNCSGRFYTVDVLVNINGQRAARDPALILNDFNALIADAAKKGKAEYPVATLTNVDRDSWTEARQRLVDLGNQDALDEIDGAMFVMGWIVKFITQ